MKVFTVILAALAALMIPTAALASHEGPGQPPSFVAKTYCVGGIDKTTPATFLGALEALVLDAAAAHGGYWALPSGVPFIDQTPNATQISVFHLKWIVVAKGSCAVASPQISSSFVCQTYDNRENPSLQLAPNAAAFLKSGWHNPVAVPGNYGGTVIGKGKWTLHCGGVANPLVVGQPAYVDFGGDLFGVSPAFVNVPGMYPLGVG